VPRKLDRCRLSFGTAGFRPFFLAAGFWSAAALSGWIAVLATGAAPPSRFGPLAWHIHEMLLGVVMATVAGSAHCDPELASAK